MRRGIFLLYFFTLFSLLLFGETNTEFSKVISLREDSESVFREAYDFISSYPLREEGSLNEAEVLHYIERFASNRGFQAEYQPLDGREDMHSFSSNLLVRVPGASEETLILGVPLDSYSTSSDRAFNPALALAFLNEWTNQSCPVTLIFLFTSADNEERSFLGSTSFLNRVSIPEKTVLLYLLLDDSSALPEIKASTSYRTSPGWYVETLRDDLETSGISHALDASGFLVNRAGLSTENLSLEEYLMEDIPAAALVSSEKTGPDLIRMSGHWLRFLHSLCRSYSRNSDNDWESNFIYWAWNKKVFLYISERTALLLSLGILSLALILMLIQQRKIHLNFKRFRKHIWSIP